MNFQRLILIVCMIAISSGCATMPSVDISSSEPGLQSLKPGLVWPPPPQTPRIQYLRSIKSPSDIGLRKSLFRKTLEAISGKEEIEGILLRPYGIYVYSDKIYATDPGIHCLHVFDTKKRKYFKITDIKGKELISPIDVAVDKDENIYLSDSVLKRVSVFDKDRNYKREIGTPEAFQRPTGLAIDDERIYVLDTLAHCVLVFNRNDGKLLFQFGKNGVDRGDFNYPAHIFIKNKQIYVTDAMNFRIQIFDRDGNFIFSFGRHGDGSGDFSKPKGIAVDSEGHIYVADAHFDNVQIFDKDGRLLLAFGNTGRGKGEMILPADVFIDETDKIYVADSYNNRIQVFQYLKAKTN
ncbi:MAG: 6-bladed beta-propeller [Nitrospirota bacterium]